MIENVAAQDNIIIVADKDRHLKENPIVNFYIYGITTKDIAFTS